MDEDLGTADPLVPNGGLVPNGTADGAPAKKQVRRVGAKPPVDRNGGNIQSKTVICRRHRNWGAQHVQQILVSFASISNNDIQG